MGKHEAREHIDLSYTEVHATFKISYLDDGTTHIDVRTYRDPVGAVRKLTEDEMSEVDFGDLEPNPWHEGGVAILSPGGIPGYTPAADNADVMMTEPLNIASKIECDLREITTRHDRP